LAKTKSGQKLKARIKTKEQTLETPLAELFKIRNGKIVEIRPFYFDGGKLAEAFRWKE
jgi:ketosteroid isomerase-like protein